MIIYFHYFKRFQIYPDFFHQLYLLTIFLLSSFPYSLFHTFTRILFPKFSCTLFPKFSCTLFPKFSGTLFPKFSGTLFPKFSGTLFPKFSGTLFPKFLFGKVYILNYKPIILCSTKLSQISIWERGNTSPPPNGSGGVYNSNFHHQYHPGCLFQFFP